MKIVGTHFWQQVPQDSQKQRVRSVLVNLEHKSGLIYVTGDNSQVKADYAALKDGDVIGIEGEQVEDGNFTAERIYR